MHSACSTDVISAAKNAAQSARSMNIALAAVRTLASMALMTNATGAGRNAAG